jgi:tetratricopeptide (TPR) repeat protein
MTDSIPEELRQVEPLIRETKLEEALKIVEDYEKITSLTDQERLLALILRGRIKSYRSGRQAYEIGVIAYNKSKDLNDHVKMIEALLLKSFLFPVDIDAVSSFVFEAENLLHSIIDYSNLFFKRVRATIDYIKGWIHFAKGDYDEAEESVFKSLELREELGYKLDISRTFELLVAILDLRGDLDMALDKALKLLTLQKEIGFQNEIASGLVTVGTVYTLKGDYENALQYINLSLSNEELGTSSRLRSLIILGSIYREKGELEKSIKTFNSAIDLAKKAGDNGNLAHAKMYIATVFRLKGEYSKAKDYLEQSLNLSQDIKNLMVVWWSLFWLAIVFIDENSLDQAQIYIGRLKELDNQTTGNLVTHVHYFAKANLEKAKGNLSNCELAKNLLKRIIGDKMAYIVIHIRALILLCELLLEDLNRTNDSEALNEVNNLISQSSMIAEKEHSHLWSTEIKLLQAKLALIQINIPETKQLLTQAQHIAEINNLTLLAQKISSEHDRLLEQLEMWEHFKKVNAPMADRLELADIDGDIDRVQGKHAVDPPELVEEVPILLLIMDSSGSTYFNHPFMANWDYSDLFSSFMSAFNTFSSEIFSKSIDRIRIGENTILITSAEPFLTCYVIKGQSYPALQKLSRFTEAIKKNSEIWQALNKSVKTSEMLELNSPPILKSVIDEIFN